MQQTIIVDDINCLEQFSQENSFGSSIISCYTQSKEELSLESLKHQIDVKNGIGINTVSLMYSNDFTSDNLIYFITQVPKNVTFIGIKAKFANEEIESIVKQKLPDNTTQSQEYEDYSDLIRLQLGYLPARQKVSIIYEYVEQLQVQVNEFWRIEINPPFLQYSKIQQQYLNQYFDIKYSQNYIFEIKLVFDRELVFYKSPTHQIQLKKIGQKNIISISLNKYDNKNKFVLLFQNQQIHKPQLLLTHVDEEIEANQKYCATIQFIPQFNKLQLDDAYQAYIQKNDIDNQEFEFSSKGEYLFLLDRSISMEGSKLNKAKQALSLLIKSLPKCSYFNIISFGTKCQFQFEQSFYNTAYTVNQALNSLQMFDASFEETNLKLAINETLKLERQVGFQRNIFILTDGQDDPDPILQLVSEASKADVRFYPLGIGNDCNQFLLQKIAFLGNGIHQIIQDDCDLNKCIINMLSDTITPIYYNFKISTNFPNESISMIVSPFREINAIKKNKPLSFQVLFDFGDQPDNYYIKISYKNENRDEEEIKIRLDRNDSQETDYFHRLAIHQEIQKVLQYAQVRSNKIKTFNKNQVNLSKQKLIDLSEKYQVVTPLTSLQSSCAQSIRIAGRNSFPLPQIKEMKQRIEQQNNQHQDPLKLKRFEQILNAFREDSQINKQILKILENDKQNLKAATTFHNQLCSNQQCNNQLCNNQLCNNQLCDIVILTLEKLFSEFKSSWKTKLSQYKQHLNTNGVDYLQSQIQMPKINFNKKTQELIDEELGDQKVNKNKKLNEILNQFDMSGQVKQNLIQILQINLDDIIFGKQLTVDQKLAIIALSILEEKFKDSIDIQISEHIKCTQAFCQNNVRQIISQIIKVKQSYLLSYFKNFELVQKI